MRRKGQGLLESALLLPLLILILAGIIEAGQTFHAWLAVSSSATTGARVCSRSGTDGVEAAVHRQLRVMHVSPTGVRIVITTAGADGTDKCTTPPCTVEYGDLVRVYVEKPHHLGLLSLDFTLSAAREMAAEHGEWAP